MCEIRTLMNVVALKRPTLKATAVYRLVLDPDQAWQSELRFPSSGQSRVEAQLGPVLTGPGELRIGLSSFSSFSSGRCSAQIDDSM